MKSTTSSEKILIGNSIILILNAYYKKHTKIIDYIVFDDRLNLIFII